MEPDTQLAKALDECLARMREGKSVDICLAANTEMHEQVEPLLYTGQFIASLPKVEPSEEYRRTAKGRLMARLHEEANQAKHARAAAKTAVSLVDDITLNIHQLWQTIAGARRVALPVALGLILIIVSTISAINFLSPSPTLADGCTLSIINGTVEIQAPAVGDKLQGTDGMTLNVGTRVKTAPDSTALLTFFDGSTLILEPGTEIEIQQLQSNDKKAVTIVLKQWMGRTWSHVVKMLDKGSRYEIETPSAVALVRGTRFLVDVDEEGKTREQTTEGLVSVTAQGEEVFVPAGQITIIEPGTTPSEPTITVNPEKEPQVQAKEKQGDNGINQNASSVLGQGNNQNIGQGNYNPAYSGQGNDDILSNGNDNTSNEVPGNDNSQDNSADNSQSNSHGNDQNHGNGGGQVKGSDNDQNQGSGNNNGNGQGNGSDNGQGNGNDNGQGNGNDNGQGNGNDNGQGNGNDNGQGNGSDNGQGNGSDNGQGNGSDNGQGNGNDNGQGNGSDNGQGNGNGSDNGQGNGNDNGQGNGSDNGQGNGSDNGQGNGSDNGQSQGNGSDNGQGNGNDNGQSQGNGSDNGQGNGNDNGQGNGQSNGNGQGNGQSNGNGNNNASSDQSQGNSSASNGQGNSSASNGQGNSSASNGQGQSGTKDKKN
jgi:hypothetical protein